MDEVKAAVTVAVRRVAGQVVPRRCHRRRGLRWCAHCQTDTELREIDGEGPGYAAGGKPQVYTAKKNVPRAIVKGTRTRILESAREVLLITEL